MRSSSGVVIGAVAGWSAWALLLAVPVLAHHGFSQFDFTRRVELQGTVQSFKFGQPHCWLTLNAASKQQPRAWKILLGSPPELTRLGIKPDSFKAGDKILVSIHPIRDGTKQGVLIEAKTADGRLIGALPPGIELPPESRVK